MMEYRPTPAVPAGQLIAVVIVVVMRKVLHMFPQQAKELRQHAPSDLE